MAKSIKDLLAGLKQVASNIGSSVNDNTGWYRQGQFTPVKQIGSMIGSIKTPNGTLGQNVQQAFSTGINPFQKIAEGKSLSAITPNQNVNYNPFLRGGADITNQGLKSFINMGSLGLVQPKMGDRQTTAGLIGSIGGGVAGFAVNPLGKTFGLTDKLVSRVAPNATGLAPKIAKGLSSELLQTLGYSTAATLGSKLGLNQQGNQFTPKNLATNLAMGSIFRGALSPQFANKALGIFAGQKAKGYAKNMEGQFSNLADKKVRFEINDSKSKIKETNMFLLEDKLTSLRKEISPLNSKWFAKKITPEELKKLDTLSGEVNKIEEFVKNKGDITLKDIFNHNELYKNYPETQNIKIKTSTFSPIQGQGSYDPQTNTLSIDKELLKNNPDKAKSVILHEIQHNIQEIEGFAKGGNINLFSQEADTQIRNIEKALKVKQDISNGLDVGSAMKKNVNDAYEDPSIIYELVTKNNQSQLEQKVKELTPQTSYQKYTRLAGEVEARDTSNRMYLTPEQRAKLQPQANLGIPIKDQILRTESNGIVNKSIKQPSISTPQVMDFETFATKNNASKFDLGESGLHMRGSNQSNKVWNKIVDNQKNKDIILTNKRIELKNQFDKLIKEGKIREPTGSESLIKTAQGDSNNQSVIAARNILDKRGINWQSTPISTPVNKYSTELVNVKSPYSGEIIQVPNTPDALNRLGLSQSDIISSNDVIGKRNLGLNTGSVQTSTNDIGRIQTKPQENIKITGTPTVEEGIRLEKSSWGLTPKNKLDRLLKSEDIYRKNGAEQQLQDIQPVISRLKQDLGISQISPESKGIKIKSEPKVILRIKPQEQPNLQNGQPIVSKTNILPLNKTKTIENPILQPSQGIVPKERGLVTSIKDTQGISESVKSGTQGTYIPKPNEVLMGEAKALLSDGATIDFKHTEGLDKKVAATIQEAINLDKAGSHEAAANLYNNLSTHATELGRGVQAFSLLDRMSPESIALSAAGKIKKYNLTATRKIPELGGEQVKMISEKVKLIDTLTGRDKNIAINELSNTINDFIPSSLADKAITVWKAGLLTSLRTHERNLLGNAVHGGAEIAKDVIATPADWLMSLKTGQRTKTFTTKGLGEFGSKNTVQQVKDIVSKGYDPSDAISKFDHKRINWGNNPVEQTLKKYTDTVFRVLGAADKPYYNAAYARSLYDQAAAEAINVGQRGSKTFMEKLVLNPTEQMLKTAISDANVATFHNKNMVTNVATALKNGLGKNELGKVISDIAMPFTGVPSAIAGQTIAYSPVGLIKGIIDTGRVLMTDIPNLQRQAAQEVGRGVVGTGLFGIGAYLMSRGLMTGQPKDANESALWQAQGKQANSVLIGGKWRSINSIGPENIVILAGAKLKEEMNKPDGSLANYAFGVGKDQLSQTFLAGVQGPLNAITDPARYGKSYAGNQAASIIPNIIKDASKALDPNARENNTIQDYMKSGIPGARNTLLPKRDNLGNIIPQEPTGVGAFFDLFNSKTPIDNAVVNEISRLYDTGNNSLPSKLSSSQTILKQKTKLTFEQLNNLEVGVGEALKPKLEQLINDPNYQKLSDEEKTSIIDKVVSDTRDKYKNVNANQFGVTANGGYVDTSGAFKQVDTTPIVKPSLTGNKIIDDKNTLTYKNDLATQATNLAKSQQPMGTPIEQKVYSYVDENGAFKEVDLTPVVYPTMTGNTVVDKKLKSSYYSSINTQINDVIKLGKAGQITQDEMIAMVTSLNTTYTKGKAGKKLTIGKIPKLTIKKMASLKIKKISIPKLAFKVTSTKGKKLSSFKIAKSKVSKPKTLKLASIKKRNLSLKLKAPTRQPLLKVASA